jgi:hypothetical protein
MAQVIVETEEEPDEPDHEPRGRERFWSRGMPLMRSSSLPAGPAEEWAANERPAADGDELATRSSEMLRCAQNTAGLREVSHAGVMRLLRTCYATKQLFYNVLMVGGHQWDAGNGGNTGG